MPRFRFSLEKVLEYRAQLEEQAKMRLAHAQRAYQDQVDIVTSLRRALDEHERALYEGDMSADRMWLWRQYKVRMAQDIRLAEREMLELAKKLNKARREAVVASKEHKLLEKLKEKQKKAHDKEEQNTEQKGFDDMASMRYRPPAF